MILTFYMAKFFKELGTTLPYSLRMMAGCDEESGMEDVEYYIRHYEEPVFLFTPDSEFPLCNGEKGHLGGNITSKKFKDGAIVDFGGGMAQNSVPDDADAGHPGNPRRRGLQSVRRLTGSHSLQFPRVYGLIPPVLAAMHPSGGDRHQCHWGDCGLSARARSLVTEDEKRTT